MRCLAPTPCTSCRGRRFVSCLLLHNVLTHDAKLVVYGAFNYGAASQVPATPHSTIGSKRAAHKRHPRCRIRPRPGCNCRSCARRGLRNAIPQPLSHLAAPVTSWVVRIYELDCFADAAGAVVAARGGDLAYLRLDIWRHVGERGQRSQNTLRKRSEQIDKLDRHRLLRSSSPAESAWPQPARGSSQTPNRLAARRVCGRRHAV